MIKNTEIQIGSFVKDRNGNIIQIDFIEHLENGYSSKIGMYQEKRDSEWFGMNPLTEHTEYVEPIEINAHWFTVLGFEEIETEEESRYYHYSKDLGNDTYLYVHYNCFDWMFSLRSVSNINADEVFFLYQKFKYVHQLQNFLNCL